MIRHLQILVLRIRAWWIQAQIDHGEELLAGHRGRLEICYATLRRIRAKEALLTPASTLLEQALRRKV
jgi:hypothetical protein